ncbi:MAG: DUF4234 domain-containing protein [Actinomycetota bacterium]
MQQEQSGLVQNLYYYIQQRVTGDWTGDPGMAVLLSLVTCGIYGLYILYKLMERRDLHLQRMANVAGTSIALLQEKAAAAGKSELVASELGGLQMVQREMYEQSRERGAVLWLVLGILTGICVLIGYYLISEDMAKHDHLEAQYFSLMSSALEKMGLAGQASQASPTIPERSAVLYLVLSIVLCCFFGIYWMYVLVDDGNRHVESQVPWEDFIYSALAGA